MDSIAFAVEMYAENHTASLAALVAAVQADNQDGITTALAVIKAQIKADGQRYSEAVVDRVQMIVTKLETRLMDTHDMVVAIAAQQAELMVLLRQVAAGQQIDVGLLAVERA